MNIVKNIIKLISRSFYFLGDFYQYKNEVQNSKLQDVEIEYGSKCLYDNNDDKYWYFKDQLHRTDGPAIECTNGDKYWYFNGKLHREDGPAIEYPGKYKAWYHHGQLHREDGPAVEYSSGSKSWFFQGKQYSKRKHLRLVKMKSLFEKIN